MKLVIVESPAKAKTINLTKDSFPKDTTATSSSGQKAILNDSILFSTTEVLYGAALFGLFDDDVTKEPVNPDSIYTVVQVMPYFPNGTDALFEYLRNNTRYPESCRKDSIQGRVIVNFVVEKDGSISGAKIVRSVHEQLDAEALRVVKSMPKWIPGKQRGKEVRVKYNIPVSFTLDGSNRTGEWIDYDE